MGKYIRNKLYAVYIEEYQDVVILEYRKIDLDGDYVFKIKKSNFLNIGGVFYFFKDEEANDLAIVSLEDYLEYTK